MNMQRSPGGETKSGARRGRLRPGQFSYSPSVIPELAQLLDLVMIVLVAVGLYFALDHGKNYLLDTYTFSVIFVGFCFNVLANRCGLYGIPAIMRPVSRSDDVIVAVATATCLLFTVLLSLRVIDDFSVPWLLAFAVSSIVVITAGRVAGCQLLKRMSEHDVIGRNVVVLGVGEQSRRFLRRMRDTNPYFMRLNGVFTYQEGEIGETFEGRPVLGDSAALFQEVREGRVDAVVVALPWNADRDLTEMVERLKELPIDVYLSTDLVGFELAFRPSTGGFSALPMFEVVQRPISGWSSAIKKLEDYVLATLILIMVAPLMLLVALAIKIDSRGPVFFKQSRLGFNNEEFKIYKFRSMYHDRPPETRVQQARKGDPRVTRVGRFIRATSLDELPQLLNVLDGTMSLVGPRPHALSHNEEYGRQIRGYFARHRVKPGITGWAQVNGLRGETETLDKMEARVRYDVYYAENWSLLFDIRILVMTGLVLFFQKSAY